MTCLVRNRANLRDVRIRSTRIARPEQPVTVS